MMWAVALLLSCLFVMPGWAAVAEHAVATPQNTGNDTAASLSVALNLSAGSNLLMFASVTTSCVTSCPTSVTATWNSGAESLTQISRIEIGNLVLHTFYLPNPTPANSSVVFTPSNNQRMSGGVQVQSGAVSPPGSAVTDSGNKDTVNCTVTVPTNGGAFAGLGKSDSTETLDITGFTERWNTNTTNGTAATNRRNAGASIFTAGSQTATGTSNPLSNRNVACSAVPVNPALTSRRRAVWLE